MEELTGPTTIKVGRVEFKKKTFFYERPSDGEIIPSDSPVDVWGFHLKGWKQIGVSDGELYMKAVKESHDIYKKTGNLELAQERLRTGFKEELESARGHYEKPVDPNYMGQPEALASMKR